MTTLRQKPVKLFTRDEIGYTIHAFKEGTFFFLRPQGDLS